MDKGEQGINLIKQLIVATKANNKEAENTLINVYQVLSNRVIEAEQKLKIYEVKVIVDYLTKPIKNE